MVSVLSLSGKAERVIKEMLKIFIFLRESAERNGEQPLIARATTFQKKCSFDHDMRVSAYVFGALSWGLPCFNDGERRATSRE